MACKRVSIVAAVFFLSTQAYALEKTGSFKNDIDGGSRGTAETKVPRVRENNSAAIDNLVPSVQSGVNEWEVMVLDILPGGGHFYRGDYFWGVTFGILKCAGIYSVYYFYRDWEYRRSLYGAAKKADREIDPDHYLFFKSGGGYKTTSRLQRDYDSAMQMLTLSVAVNAFIYTASMLINHNRIAEYNKRTIPTFDIYSSSVMGQSEEKILSIRFNYRI